VLTSPLGLQQPQALGTHLERLVVVWLHPWVIVMKPPFLLPCKVPNFSDWVFILPGPFNLSSRAQTDMTDFIILLTFVCFLSKWSEPEVRQAAPNMACQGPGLGPSCLAPLAFLNPCWQAFILSWRFWRSSMSLWNLLNLLGLFGC
jgi:hypothetical protein